MRHAVPFATVLAIFGGGVAHAGEALLIRHEVLTVPVGEEIPLRPGFFIGKAWTADPSVAKAGISRSLRQVEFVATSPGRTIVSTWSLREPEKRIEYEVVVVPAEKRGYVEELAERPRRRDARAPDETCRVDLEPPGGPLN